MAQQQNNETTYLFVTIGSRTKRGARVTTATSGLTVAGLAIARVGDIVTYANGSEAVIIDGAGEYAASERNSIALVGSHLSNGDCIIETLQDSWGILVHESQTIKGLFDPSYVMPPLPPPNRLAVQGATTARGGVLLEPSGTWNTGVRFGKAGAVGDLIHYSDGSTARIVSGLGLADNRDFTPLAFVGSELDNGDTITDSPEREGALSSEMFIVVKRSGITHGGQDA
jgi:uncharacterized Zn-binding protein involved in type VI secretion